MSRFTKEQFNAVFRQYDDLTVNKGMDELQTELILNSVFSKIPGLVPWFFEQLKSGDYLDDKKE